MVEHLGKVVAFEDGHSTRRPAGSLAGLQAGTGWSASQPRRRAKRQTWLRAGSAVLGASATPRHFSDRPARPPVQGARGTPPSPPALSLGEGAYYWPAASG